MWKTERIAAGRDRASGDRLDEQAGSLLGRRDENLVLRERPVSPSEPL
ncbi:hypothetical protein [Halalkalicoccus jeotgali]|uniref:Uncharacterized protein n=1 Tax=Halalkalicoccus jeotgali (strain DSM 18796 / CECT 7217 / JCM 14584 / KCTC 4019 / B3) TaxID=795797 RepID=D8J6F6_HALJB|nr:hypothetical protein [Halalkalicoccus jeotgali]ADJ13833.1 hypothetical protein HacjB3_02200 [Halalkalicoccus jeotgali B3]ELY34121.1 hypothetical protein C497_17117 [Halalkalicoccus jeotgali B3]